MNLRNRRHFSTWLVISAVLSLATVSGLFRPAQDSLVDLLFTRKLPPSNVVIIEIDENSINEIGQWPWPRQVFAQLIRQLNEAAVIGIDVNFKEPSRYGQDDDDALAEAIRLSQPPVVLTAEMQSSGKLAMPISPVADDAIVGFPNLVLGPDGVARVIRYVKNEYQSFALQISQQYQQQTSDMRIAVIPADITRIDYQGPDRTFTLIPARDVQEKKIPASFFKNKIVLIGATARDLQDFHHTPMGIISGVEIQASIITTLLNQRFYTSDTLTMVGLIAGLSGLTILFGMFLQRLRFYLPALALIFASYNIAAFLSFDRYRVLDLLYPNLAIILSAIASITVQYFFTHREKKLIQDTFSRYLAPQVIHELLHDPSAIKLGGKRETLSILFSDIRNFTTMSETMSPEQLTGFLNEYLSHMTGIVLERNGVIDKYIGDAIMAFWGAPLPNKRHALDSVVSALHMVDALATFNASSKDKGNPVIDVGIGINSGEVTVGNMGSEKRFDYTVLGDNVNLASRVEGLTKTYGVNIIVTQATIDLISPQDRASHQLMLRELDHVQVKGKKVSVTLWEVVPRFKQANVAAISEWFDKGRQAYYKGSFTHAIEMFDNVLRQLPGDGPSHVLRERCEELLTHPHPDWQGVYELTHK